MVGRGAWLGQVMVRSRRLGVTTISDAGADTDPTKTAETAILEFWKPGCDRCVEYQPVFDEVASRAPHGMFVGSVNVDDSPIFASRYGIEATPTTIFLSDGMEVNRVEGKLTKQGLEALIQSSLGISFGATASALSGIRRPALSASSLPATTIVAGVVAIGLALAGLSFISARKS